MMLLTLFESPSDLKRLSSFLQWLAISLVFCGGFVQVLRLVVDQKEKIVSGRITQQKEDIRLDKEKELEKQLAKSQTDLAKLEAKQHPWVFTEDQKQLLIESLRSTQKHKLVFFAALSEPERSGKMASQVIKVFSEAGFDTSLGLSWFPNISDTPLKGIIIQYYTKDHESDATTYCLLFRKAGLAETFIELANDSSPFAPIGIYIGNRP